MKFVVGTDHAFPVDDAAAVLSRAKFEIRMTKHGDDNRSFSFTPSHRVDSESYLHEAFV